VAARTKQKVASRTDLAKLVHDQEFRCALSGVVLEPACATLDHKMPVSLGGGHDIDNLQVVHDTVNRMKGTLSNEEFVRWCSLVSHWSR
jgi:hypothetical protein